MKFCKFVTNRLHIPMRRDVFQAIADPTRREINHIAHQRLNLNTVADHFDISRPAISKHIKILTECGLVVIHQEGRERFCESNLAALSEVDQWIGKFKTFWTMKLESLEKHLENDGKAKSKKSKKQHKKKKK